MKELIKGFRRRKICHNSVIIRVDSWIMRILIMNFTSISRVKVSRLPRRPLKIFLFGWKSSAQKIHILVSGIESRNLGHFGNKIQSKSQNNEASFLSRWKPASEGKGSRSLNAGWNECEYVLPYFRY